MALDDFMDGFDGSESPETESDDEDKQHDDDYSYSGDKQLLDVGIDDVERVLGDTDLSFSEKNVRIQGRTWSVISQNGGYIIVVSYPKDEPDRDCIKVHVLENESLYDVIHPYEVYMVDEWEDELIKAIDAIKDNHDELMHCPRCGSVMIIRTTNANKELIRGCSDYPDCKYNESE